MNPFVEAVPPSLIRSINARKRPGDIDLGLGEPTIPPAIGPFEAAVEWTRRNGSPYSPNAGFAELRQAIAEYLGPVANGALSADNVCVTVGSEEALYLAIKAVLDPTAEEVLIVEPCYLAYPKLCILEGIRYRMLPLSAADGFAPRAAAVLAEIRPDTRMVIINTPGNPTGRVWPVAELRALADGLAGLGRDDVYVVADEVYRELCFVDAAPSMALFHANTLVAGSLSKSNSLTGLRLGWLAGPSNAIDAAIRVHQFVNTAASTLSQRVAIEIFRDSGSLSAFLPHYQENRSILLAAAAEGGIDMIPPEGAFYGFIRLSTERRVDSLAFAERLLEERRVVAVPGRAFGESGEGWLRVSWVAPRDQLAEGMKRIGEAVAAST